MLPELVVLNRQRAERLDMKWLRKFASKALVRCAEHSADGLFTLKELEEVVVTVVSDRKIAELHVDFMQVEGATDVITFQHGEVVVSAQTAARYAKEHGHGLMEEIGLYVIHGFLHLNAYEDGSEIERAKMHAVQDEIWRESLLDV